MILKNRVNACLKNDDSFIYYKKKPKFNPIFYCLRHVDVRLYRVNFSCRLMIQLHPLLERCDNFFHKQILQIFQQFL